MKAEDLIIDRPDLQSLRQRYATSFITFAFWVLWFYIWLPMLSLIAWGLGIKLFYEEMIARGGYEQFIESALFYFLTVLLIAVIFLTWAGYNLYRFRGKSRRKAITPYKHEEYAAFFSVDSEQLTQWKQLKVMTVYHDDQENISRVTQKTSKPPSTL